MERDMAELSKKLHSECKPIELKKGTPLVEIGKKPEGVYFIKSDDIRRGSNGVSRDKKEFETIPVGLKELILNTESTQNIEVSDDCAVSFLPADKFENLFEKTEWFPREISRLVSRQVNMGVGSGQENHVKRLEKLVEVSRIVNSTLDLNKLLKIILDTALENVDGDRGTLYMLNAEKNELWSKVFEGEKSIHIELPVGKGIAGKVAETGETMNIKDASKDDRFNPEVDRRTNYTTENILCMPLKNKEGKILGVFQLLNKKNGTFTEQDEEFIDALSIQVSSAIENARLYEQEQKKIEMEKEMMAAGEVQKNLFPSDIPQVDGYRVAAINIPARETSGDLYDFTMLEDNRLVFSLGDVSGKGLPASILMANLQSVLNDLPHHNPSPAYCITRSNAIINRVSSSEKFITLFLGVIDPESHTLTYSNAGHEYPFMVSDGKMERLSDGGVPVGILPEYPFEEKEYKFEPGDRLVVFSDGASDATNGEDEFFSEERLESLVMKHNDLTADELLDKICDEIKTFTGDAPQFDDITLVIVSREK